MKPLRLSARVAQAKYAVRGAIVQQAAHYEDLLRTDPQRQGVAKDLPFDQVIYSNVGNPQQLGQKPITFVRQVCAMLEYPPLCEESFFPEDARARARDMLKEFRSVGAYSASAGVDMVRRHIADFIAERDGVKASRDSIFLTEGASGGVSHILESLAADDTCGVMVPIPQYPLYEAKVALYGSRLCGYFLEESNGWGLDLKDLHRSYDEAVSEGTTVQCLVVINPGNPTGGVLTTSNMQDIVRFAHERNLLLVADEVYQQNDYIGRWSSFRKVLHEMGPPYSEEVGVVSCHTVSKGVLGECGHRSGYIELHNTPADLHASVLKLASISLCPSVVGQAVMDVMVNPPKPGDASYDLYHQETTGIYESLKRRAEKVAGAFGSMEGIEAQPVEGSMYIFVNIRLPDAAIRAAEAKGEAPDFLYCREMLEQTGIVTVPGSGFRQRDGTHHMRVTILPQEDQIDLFVDKARTFHDEFMKRYQ